MTNVIYLFWIFTILSCAYAWAYGGRDGRIGAGLFMLAVILTIPALAIDRHWATTQWAVASVDILYLAGMYSLAMVSRSYWPIWVTGFHTITVITHLTTIFEVMFDPRIYSALSTFWVIPMLFAMTLGIALDRRANMLAPQRNPASESRDLSQDD